MKLLRMLSTNSEKVSSLAERDKKDKLVPRCIADVSDPQQRPVVAVAVLGAARAAPPAPQETLLDGAASRLDD